MVFKIDVSKARFENSISHLSSLKVLKGLIIQLFKVSIRVEREPSESGASLSETILIGCDKTVDKFNLR